MPGSSPTLTYSETVDIPDSQSGIDEVLHHLHFTSITDNTIRLDQAFWIEFEDGINISILSFEIQQSTLEIGSEYIDFRRSYGPDIRSNDHAYLELLYESSLPELTHKGLYLVVPLSITSIFVFNSSLGVDSLIFEVDLNLVFSNTSNVRLTFWITVITSVLLLTISIGLDNRGKKSSASHVRHLMIYTPYFFQLIIVSVLINRVITTHQFFRTYDIIGPNLYLMYKIDISLFLILGTLSFIMLELGTRDYMWKGTQSETRVSAFLKSRVSLLRPMNEILPNTFQTSDYTDVFSENEFVNHYYQRMKFIIFQRVVIGSFFLFLMVLVSHYLLVGYWIWIILRKVPGPQML